jgi:FkbH-like protein
MRAFAVGEARRRSMTLDGGVGAELRATRAAVAARSLLLWDEHCSECAMPTCFATCSLYTPRQDFKCRRFERGIENLVVSEGSVPLMSIAFRHWGKLEAKGDGALVSGAGARFIEAIAPMGELIADEVPLSPRTRRRAGRGVDLLKALAARTASSRAAPDIFVLEVINPGQSPVGLTFTVKAETPGHPGLFQARADIRRGYNRVCFPAADILSRVGQSRPLLFQIEPFDTGGEAPSLLFGLVDFVSLRPGARLEETAQSTGSETPTASGAGKVKCVVWDLDNTLWSGTLIEDGPDTIRLNPKAAELIVELDRRGILNSIASKNSREEAEEVLKRFGLWEYFLQPQIHWNPKSGSLGAIASALNIGVDSLVFIDDQAFERSEVQSAYPSVETFDEGFIDEMLSHSRFDVIVTDESRRRRSMYQVEQVRQDALEGAAGDYAAFLRNCSIRLTIDDLDDRFLNRAFELTERTNQLNYSGVRLSRAELEGKMKSQDSRVLVLSVSDKFGDYGVIGVAVLDADSWTVECFFMSCRVQRKKVEHAFFEHLLRLGETHGRSTLSVRYKATPKNEPSRVVLEDEMMFHSGSPDGASRLFHLATTTTIPEGDIVNVEDRSRLSLPFRAVRAPA